MSKRLVAFLVLTLLLIVPSRGQATSIEIELMLADAEEAVDGGIALTTQTAASLRALMSETRDRELRGRAVYCLGRDATRRWERNRTESNRQDAENWLLKARSQGLSSGRSMTILADLMVVGSDAVKKDAARDYLNRGKDPKILARARQILTAGQTLDIPWIVLNEIRHWSNPDYTRIVLYLSSSLTPKYSFLPADADLKLPSRLYLDLQHARIDPAVANSYEIKDGLLTRIRAAQNDRNTVRVVLDFASFQRYQVVPNPDGSHIVIDVYGSKKAEQPKQPMIVDGDNNAKERRIIMIDAGHGGKDPGAIGPGGIREKDVVLKVALRAATLLRQAGYDVVMTRDNDTFLELYERTGLAAKARADLFLSIHANASESSTPFGFSTYYLAKPSDASAQKVAARENNVTVAQLGELEVLLQELAFSKNSEGSHVFAKLSHNAVVAQIRKLPPFHDMGIKSAPFYVMYGAQMPSILMEVGFVSNHKDARKIASSDFADKVARGLVEGVRKYFVRMRSKTL